MIKDKTYLIKTEVGYKVIKKINNFKAHVCVRENNESQAKDDSPCLPNEYKWVDTGVYMNEFDKMFVNGEFVTYDTTSNADSFFIQNFKSSNPIVTYRTFKNIASVMSTQGLLFNSQEASSANYYKRIYTGERDEKMESRFSSITSYGIYSQIPKSYEEIFEELNDENIFYSTLSKKSKKIHGDALYNLENIDFLISGEPSKVSVTAQFNPVTKEEGKRTFIYMLLYNKNGE